MLRGAASAVVFIYLGILAVLLFQQPLGTNDGPAHVAFADLITHLDDPGRELQRQAYVPDLRLRSNVLVYLILAPLIALTSHGLAESMVQALCLLGPAAAGWVALRMIDRENAWLALFIVPMSFQQMLFLGLYNFLLSVVGFFLAIAAYLWMRRAPSWFRSATLGVTLCITLLAHAGGFLSAVAGVAAMTVASFVMMKRRGASTATAFGEQSYALVALGIPLPLLLLSMASGSGSAILYGVSPLTRIYDMLTLTLMNVGDRTERLSALAIGITLLTAAAHAARRSIKAGPETSSARFASAVQIAAALLASIGLLLVFPDSYGGGWTHVRRFMIFPYFWLLLLLAHHKHSSRLKLCLLAVAGIASVVMLAGTVSREQRFRAERTQWAPLAHLIGAHCTVLPLVFDARPHDGAGSPVRMNYEPYRHAASYFELANDRVVLFNFLARLNQYPIRFKSTVEPQSRIFHWEDGQQNIRLDAIDIDGFERDSGLRVDYLLLVGDPGSASDIVRKPLQNALSRFEAVYRSQDQRTQLYRRLIRSTGTCTEQPTVASNAMEH